MTQVTVSALLNFYFAHVKWHSLDEYGVSGYVINTDYNEFRQVMLTYGNEILELPFETKGSEALI